MGITAALTFLTSLFVLALLGGIGLIGVNAARGRPTRIGVVVAVVGLIGVLILVPLNSGLVLVQPNETGVVFRQTARGDAALREPLQSGLQWVVPFVDQVIIYNVGQQSVDMAGTAESVQVGQVRPAVRAISNDGQVIVLDVTVIFRLDGTKVNQIHRNWRETYVDGFIVPQTRSEVRNAVSEYGAEEIYSGGRAALETQITDALRVELAREGFLLTDVLIRDISFSEQFTEAIEQKQIAEQQAQQAAFRVQQAEQEAQQARVEAQGLADAAVIAAEGNAQATVLQAQAESEALRLINEILAQNPNLIQYQYINQLGDNVRLIIVPSNSPFLFNLQDLLNQAGVEPTTEPLPPPAEAPPTQQP
jgi:regulator of protease activity HflC (stomatin/prohibitin superfamily)